MFIRCTSEFRVPNRVKYHGFGVKDNANRLDRHGTQRRQKHKCSKDIEGKKLRGKKLYQMHVERWDQVGSHAGEVKDGGCGKVKDTIVEKHLNFGVRHT